MELRKRYKSLAFNTWMRTTIIGVTLIVALVVVGVAYAARFIIDPFSAGAQFVFAQAGQTTDAFVRDLTIPSSILGVERHIQVDSINTVLYVAIAPGVDDRLDFAAGPGGIGTALVQWDGEDGLIALDHTGLCAPTCADFTDSGSNDSFVMRLLTNDNPAEIEFRAYSNSTDWSYYRFDSPGGIDLGDVVDIVIPFDSFNDNGDGANWLSIGAFELIIDATSTESVDLSIDFLHTDSVRDFGDLPETASVPPDPEEPGYPGLTYLATDGARHVTQGLRLGPNADAQVDTEADGQPNIYAGANQPLYPGGDDGNPSSGPNDEDGVSRNMSQFWQPGATVELFVEVYGCPDPGPCYLNGWIDWDRNGSFVEVGDQVYSDQEVYNGVNTLPVDIPSPGYTQGDAVFSRFRLCESNTALPDGCNSLTGETINGEVEDYWWDFEDPNAITLSNIEANSSTSLIIVAAAGLLLLVSGGAILVFKRRRA